MFRASHNHVSIEVQLAPVGPILVRSGKAGHDPLRPDVAAIRTQHARGETVYLPGSGLKGVLRSQAERILRANGRSACDPFALDSDCNKRRDQQPPEVFRTSCSACRTFGSTRVAGRLRIGDAYPTEATWADANRTEVRNGVGIERRTQAAAQGVLYDMEVVTRGVFTARIDLENFELWQLALLLQVLADLDAGFVQVGGMKSRGLGTVQVAAMQLTYQATRSAKALQGLAACMATDAPLWGLQPEPDIVPDRATVQPAGLRPRLVIADKAGVLALLDQLAAQVWPAFLTRRA
jgi:CRISPR-associated RAMP protein (TIGR02581 family)